MSTPSVPTSDFTDTFARLSEFVFQLHYDWAMYLALYGDASTVEILNASAPNFFGREQGRLRDTIFLSIARLFDPAFSMNNVTKTNLTLPALVELLRGTHPDLALEIETDISTALTEAEVIKTERNKRIAHLDRATALGTNLINDITREEVNTLIINVVNIILKIDSKINSTYTDLTLISIQANNDVKQLVSRLSVTAKMAPRELATHLLNS